MFRVLPTPIETTVVISCVIPQKNVHVHTAKFFAKLQTSLLGIMLGA